MSKIYFLRHSIIKSNSLDIFIGQGEEDIIWGNDVILHDLPNLNDVFIITSTSKRCIQTLGLLCSKLASQQQKIKVEILTSNLILERNTGLFQGKSKKQIRMEFPEFFKENGIMIPTKTPPKGETFENFVDRIKSFYLSLRKYKKNSKIIIIGHLHVFRLLKLLNLQLDIETNWDTFSFDFGTLKEAFEI